MLNSTVARCPKINFSVDRSVGRDLWTEWAAVIPAHHSFEDVCKPAYFGQLRSTRMDGPRQSDNGIRVRDRIAVSAEDGSWVAKFIVRHIAPGVDEVHTAIIEHLSFEAGDLPEGYKIEKRGARGWIIFFNNAEIEGGFATPESAERRLKAIRHDRGVEDKIDAMEAETRPKRGRKSKVEEQVEEVAPAAE